MVSQANAHNGRSLHATYLDVWAGPCKPQQDADTRSDGSARTIDEAADLEGLAWACRDDADADACGSPRVSGLPLVCSNCGVSFFSLQIPDDQVDCYCSGECKWSVIMYREMDLRMFAMRRHLRRQQSACSSSSCYDNEDDSLESFSFSDDSTASSSCS